MCIVKAPKIKNTGETDKNKPLPILRNPLLDGIDQSIRSLAIGRSSLRIDRNSPGGLPNPGGVSGGGSGGGGGALPGSGGGGGGSSPRDGTGIARPPRTPGTELQ